MNSISTNSNKNEGKISKVGRETGSLFESLWKPYAGKDFQHSVDLFEKRFRANGFDLAWFQGKKCLDAGCGGGRYSIAMAKAGAREVIGVDVGGQGLEDARDRAKDLSHVKFQEASVLNLPFEDGTFDFVLSSGVLMCTENPEQGFNELCRVLKPGGKLYMLLYATGGVRWPAVMDYRHELRSVPNDVIKSEMVRLGFPARKVRTLQDDLKVPYTDFYTWEFIVKNLERNSMENIERWESGRLDHEEDLETMIEDMKWFGKLFKGASGHPDYGRAFTAANQRYQHYIDVMQWARDSVKEGRLTEDAARVAIIGQGHHRYIATKRPQLDA